jgi:hypothetical protein
MTHCLGIIGLATNMAGSVLLIWFPPTVSGYTADGSRISGGGAWSEHPASDAERQEGRRHYVRRQHLFRFAVALLAFGFFLQLVDLIRS